MISVKPSSRERECGFCGNAFYDRQATTIRQKYCSHRCQGQAKHARAVKSYPPEAELRALYAAGETDRAIGRRYGHTCMWALGVRRFYGIAGKPRGSWRAKPLAQRGDRARWGMHRKPEKNCRNCGATGRLDLHHAIPRSRSKAAKYDLRNGIPLCDVCHFGWHHKKLVICREVFKPEEWEYISSVQLVDRDITAWLDKHYPPARISVAA